MRRGTGWRAAPRVAAAATGVAALIAGAGAAAQPPEATPNAQPGDARAAPPAPGAPAAPAAPLVQPGRAALVYTRGPGAASCDDERTFRAWLAAELGADPFAPRPASATVRLETTRAPDGFRATLVIESPRGTERARHTRAGRDCNDALDRLAIDVVLDLFRPRRTPAPAPAPASTAAPAGSTDDCDPCAQRTELDALRRAVEAQQRELAYLRRALSRTRVAAEEERQATESRLAALEREYRSRMDVTFALSTGAFLTLGLTNNVGVGFLVGGELHSGILAIGLEARGTLPSEFGPKSIGDDVVDYSRFQGSLVPCARYWYVFGCAVLTVGAEIHQYPPAYSPASGVGPVWELGPRAGAEIPLGKMLAVRVWGEVLFNPYPTTYGWSVNDVEVSRKQLPGVAGFVGAGLVVHFGKKQQ